MPGTLREQPLGRRRCTIKWKHSGAERGVLDFCTQTGVFATSPPAAESPPTLLAAVLSVTVRATLRPVLIAE